MKQVLWVLLLSVLSRSGLAAAQEADAGVPPGTLALPAATVKPAGSAVKLTASAKDGFSLASDDGNWALRFGGVFWASFTEQVNQGVAGAPHFGIPLARLQVRATLFRPWLRFFFQPEFSGTPRVLDLELTIQPWDALGLRVGQLQPGFSRAWLSPVPKLQFQGFTVANTLFRPERQTGALLFGAFFDGRLEYFAGLFDGNGINHAANDNPQLMWNARLAGTVFGTPPGNAGHVKYDETVHLAGDIAPTLLVGIDGYINRVTTGAPGGILGPQTEEQQVASADLSFAWKRFFAQAEGYVMRSVPIGGIALPTVLRSGFDVQAGFFVIRSVLEVAGRFSWLHFDNHVVGAWVVQGDGQLNYYLAGNTLKVGLRYSPAYSPVGGVGGFSAGLTHTLFAQAQVWL